MKAMILAAGLGSRMRPLTDHTPKPLLSAGGRPLIAHHLEKLADCGIRDVVINTHWLADQLPERLGSGARWQLNLHFRHEPELLETAGGIRNALDLLDDADDTPFLVVNGDIYMELDLNQWLQKAQRAIVSKVACLALVDNPEHNPDGDFGLKPQQNLVISKTDAKASATSTFTYAGLGLFRPSLFRALPQGPARLAPLLHNAVANAQLGGLATHAYWSDIGTPERLEALNQRLS